LAPPTPVAGDGLLFFAAWSDGKADDPWPSWEKFLERFTTIEREENQQHLMFLQANVQCAGRRFNIQLAPALRSLGQTEFSEAFGGIRIGNREQHATYSRWMLLKILCFGRRYIPNRLQELQLSVLKLNDRPLEGRFGNRAAKIQEGSRIGVGGQNLGHGKRESLCPELACSVDVATNDRDSQDPGFNRIRWLWIVNATLAIAGVPPLSGFFSKDEILTAAHARGQVDPVWLVFWGLALGAALLTAFYMTRLMLYTFHGPNRTGEKEQEHLHEAPWIMTGPLLLLGVLSAAGGVINIPELYHGNAWLHHWLEPITQPGAALAPPEAHLSPGTEWLLIGIAVAVAVTGIVGAWQLLKPQALVPAPQAPEERGFARVLKNKWYVDEIYDALIVRPLVWFSREVLWKQVDQRAIDGAGVNGAARGARALGWANRWLQTGQVGIYVAVFVIGVLLIIWRATS